MEQPGLEREGVIITISLSIIYKGQLKRVFKLKPKGRPKIKI